MRALRIGNRAARVGARAQTVGCSDCCGPTKPDAALFYQACPCISYVGYPCAIADTPCIYVDTRTVVGGVSGDDLYRALLAGERFVIRHDGICYDLTYRWYAAELDPLDARIGVLPPGATAIGGEGVALDRREDCVSGCADVNVGPEFFEVHRCDGCPSDERWFVCARAVAGWSIVGINGVPWCIDRSTGYSQTEAESLGLTTSTPGTPYIWVRGANAPARIPAPSCCFAVDYTCVGDACLRGKQYASFGPNRWFPLDTCCGTRNGFRYQVTLAYSRVIVSTPNLNGDVVRTEISADYAVTSEPAGADGVVSIPFTITTRGYTNGVLTFDGSSDASVSVEAHCCLKDSGVVPQLDRVYVPDDPETVPGEPGYYYSRREAIGPGDAADLRRQAWQASPFSIGTTLAPKDDAPGSTYSSAGAAFGACGVWTFQHQEVYTYANGATDSVNINFRVQVVPDSSPPCAQVAPCTSAGWAEETGGTLP